MLNPEQGEGLSNQFSVGRRVGDEDRPDMYWDRSSRPMAAPPGPIGSHNDFTGILKLGPGTTDMSFAVACPNTEPLFRRRIFTYGTVAEYSVGFVMLIFASRLKVDLVVATISKDPTCRLKFVRFLPDIAESNNQPYIFNCYLTCGKCGPLTLSIEFPFSWDIPHHESPKC